MSNNLFQFTEGKQKIENVYFTRGLPGENVIRRKKCLLAKDDKKVFVNIELSNMYRTSGASGKIAPDSKIYFDLFAIDEKQVSNIGDENNLKEYRDSILLSSQYQVYQIDLSKIDEKEKIPAKSKGTESPVGTPDIENCVAAYSPENVPEEGSETYEHGIYVKKIYPRNVTDTSKVTFRLHISFAVHIADPDLFYKDFGGWNMLGWAWIDTPAISRKEYSEGFSRDIRKPTDRAEMLLKPDSEGTSAPAIDEDGNEITFGDLYYNSDFANDNLESERHAINLQDNRSFDDLVMNTNLLPGTIFNRTMQDSNSPDGDGFPFDEPASNSIKIVADTPFGGIFLGNQPGQVGLTVQSQDIIDETIGKDTRNYPIGHFRPWDFPDLQNNIKFPNETFVRGDHRVFVNPGSICHWLNCFEKTLEYSSAAGPSLTFDNENAPKLVTQLPMNMGADQNLRTAQAFFHNFKPPINRIRNYDVTTALIESPVPFKELLIDYPLYYTGAIHPSYLNEKTNEIPKDTFRGVYNNQCDFSLFTSITELHGDIVSSKDEVVGTMGKGYPDSANKSNYYTDSMHSKLQLEENDKWITKQGFGIQHRPILLAINLVRPLTEEEVTEYNNDPFILHMYYTDKKNKCKSFQYKLIVDFSDSAYGAGSHLFLLYPVFADAKAINETMKCHFGYGNSLLTLQNEQHPKLKIWKRYINIPFSKTTSFTTYKPAHRGLFEDNPIIFADDIMPAEIRDKNISAAKDEADEAFVKESINLVTQFTPKYRGVVNNTYNSFMQIYKTDIPEDKLVDSGNTFLETLYKKFLKTKKFDLAKNIGVGNSKLIGAKGKKIFGIANQANDIFASIENFKKIVDKQDGVGKLETHPFWRGEKFGEGHKQHDTLLSVSVDATHYYYKKGYFQKVESEAHKNVPLLVMNRKVDPQTSTSDYTVVNVQVNKVAGFITRDTETESSPDSLSPYITDFFLKLDAFRKNLSSVVKINDDSSASVKELISVLEVPTELYAVLDDTMDKESLKTSDGKKVPAKVNSNLAAVLKENKIPEIAAKALNPANWEDPKSDEVVAFLHLLFYMNTFFPRCPSCGQTVSLSWGWCPYHGTSNDIEYVNKDGNSVITKEEFLTYLDDPAGDRSKPAITIANELRSNFKNDNTAKENSTTKTKNKRLLVHWTEFLLQK